MFNIRTYFKNNKKILPSLLVLFSLTACDGIFESIIDDLESMEDAVCETDTTTVDFKRVGYWNGNDRDNLDDVDYSQLTYLFYTYLTVNADGSLNDFDVDEEMEGFISDARTAGVTVGISIGGPGYASTFETIANSSSITSTFVNNVITFLEDNDLEGVDLNWQTPSDDEGELFEDLVEDLSEALWDDGYFFSISVISGVGDDEDLADVIDRSVFDYVDFVNVRAFDTDNSDDLHSSQQDAIDAIDYWTGRCLIQNKLVLGIPLYSAGDSVDTYADIIDFKRADACTDESQDRNYNGIPTVIYKTNYALSYAGGVMLMSLEEDTYKDSLLEYSLLNVMSETALGETVTLCD
ncbi:glycosyl hydrolase family 18 protein [Psychromonas antarctica]|uniref:glycosyl hydrolase family 18 protein n=1 Tax=Psychromonas antarctica TaxID=67573 RepID=UPI001EE79D0B|nr:glycosyl hydrolase family 18 protein [Psychromonas antarctica]MCG6200566.1 glycosyl hydrolase family 18 protein [Psychromonas antarctica]